MTRSIVRAAAAVLALLAVQTVGSSRASAQAAGSLRGPFVGIGAGVGEVRDQTLEDHRFGVLLHARAGWGLAHAIAPMLEVNFSGLGDDEPLQSDIVFITPSAGVEQTQVARRPSTLSTFSVLASVQVGLPGAFYVRPGVGVASHAFPVYDFSDDTPTAGTSHEAGPSAGIAIGRTMNLSRRFPIAVEGIAHWSGGEDSTGSRWAAGIQVVPMIRF